MNLTRCKNGHFYDTDRFSTCPHCMQNNNASQSDATESIYKAPAGNQEFSYADDVTCAVDSKPMNYGRNTIVGGAKAPNHNESSDETEALTSPFHKNISPTPVPAQAPPVSPIPPVEKGSQPKSGQIAGENIQELRGKINPDRNGYPGNDLRKQIDDVTMPNNMQYMDDEVTQRITFPGRDEKRVDLVVGWLVCVKGNSIGKSFCLRSGKNFIGRDASMDVVIADDRSVSRNRHAIVIFDPKSKAFLVEPGMSRELFYLDDELVLTPQIIKAYQVLTIGNTDLMFVPLCGEHFDWEKQMDKNAGK